jgi:hypothetical protein
LFLGLPMARLYAPEMDGIAELQERYMAEMLGAVLSIEDPTERVAQIKQILERNTLLPRELALIHRTTVRGMLRTMSHSEAARLLRVSRGRVSQLAGD